MARQSAYGHVAECFRLSHVSHYRELRARQSARLALGTRGLVVQLADSLPSQPRTKAGSGEANDGEGMPTWHDRAGASNRGEELGLVLSVGKTVCRESHAAYVHENQDEPEQRS